MMTCARLADHEKTPGLASLPRLTEPAQGEEGGAAVAPAAGARDRHGDRGPRRQGGVLRQHGYVVLFALGRSGWGSSARRG